MGNAGPTLDQAERLAFSLLRRGDILGALAAAEQAAAERRTLRLAVLAAEASVCFGGGDLDTLEHLQDQVASEGDDTLALRMDATLADYHATRGNPRGGAIAGAALAEVGGQPLTSTEALWARGRLWRTLALYTLFIPADRPGRSLAMVERARSDLVQAGFDAEWARCTADLHFVWTIAFAEDPDLDRTRARATVAECLARLRQLDSSYVDLVLAYTAFLELAEGDIAASHLHAAEVDRIAASRPIHPFALVIVSYLRVSTRLVADGPTEAVLAAVDRHIAMVRAEAPPVTAGHVVGLAGILLDLSTSLPHE